MVRSQGGGERPWEAGQVWVQSSGGADSGFECSCLSLGFSPRPTVEGTSCSRFGRRGAGLCWVIWGSFFFATWQRCTPGAGRGAGCVPQAWVQALARALRHRFPASSLPKGCPVRLILHLWAFRTGGFSGLSVTLSCQGLRSPAPHVPWPGRGTWLTQRHWQPAGRSEEQRHATAPGAVLACRVRYLCASFDCIFRILRRVKGRGAQLGLLAGPFSADLQSRRPCFCLSFLRQLLETKLTALAHVLSGQSVRPCTEGHVRGLGSPLSPRSAFLSLALLSPGGAQVREAPPSIPSTHLQSTLLQHGPLLPVRPSVSGQDNVTCACS